MYIYKMYHQHADSYLVHAPSLIYARNYDIPISQSYIFKQVMFKISESFYISIQQVYELHMSWMFSDKLIHNIIYVKMFIVKSQCININDNPFNLLVVVDLSSSFKN